MSNVSNYERVYASGEYDVASVYDHIVRIRQRYLPEGGVALDHGFGNGVIAAYLTREGFDVHGTEVAQAGVDKVAERADTWGLKADHFVLNEGPGLPYPDGMFDAIVSNQVLSLVGDRDVIAATVAEFARTLKPGGKVAATTMHPDSYFFTEFGPDPLPDSGPIDVHPRGRLHRDYTMYRYAGDQDLRDLFESAGLVVDDLGWFGFKLLDVSNARFYIVLAHKP